MWSNITDEDIEFQSTRSARSATGCIAPSLSHVHISIHALRKERDLLARHIGGFDGYFNPRAPQGARLLPKLAEILQCDFNPRAPQGARPREPRNGPSLIYFNPRAPQGARPRQRHYLCRPKRFQSTRSARSATRTTRRCREQHVNFNPRAPQGARPTRRALRLSTRRFQSTRSARSATHIIDRQQTPRGFQSTRSARSATTRP